MTRTPIKPLDTLKVSAEYVESCKTMWDKLTIQQQNVCKLIALGVPRDEICATLGIARKTLDATLWTLRQTKLGGMTADRIPLFVFFACEIIPGPFEI